MDLLQEAQIDAHIIRLFGEQVQSTPATPRTSEQKRLTALTRRRKQVIELLNQEKNRLGECHFGETEQLIKNQTAWDETKKGDGRVTSSSPTCSIGA